MLASALAAVFLFAGIGAATSWTANGSGHPSHIAKSLLEKAKKNPNETIRVIIQSTGGTKGAEKAFAAAGGSTDGQKLNRKLGIVGAVAVEIKASKLDKLASISGLIVTPDDPMKASGSTVASSQLWPAESGNAQLWGPVDTKLAAKMPAIAIVDSGIEADRLDFTGRIVANVNLATATPNSPGDGRGHGTFVAGIAAGAAPGHAGASPGAKLVSIDVMNDAGMAWTSDVIAAADWILANKAAYNIRVANFSLHASNPSSFTVDPLDKAVERLWLKGVTVVAAAGNYGTGGPGDVKYAPANDPFVITVGAVDLSGSATVKDDFAAPWSVYGYTYDGFRKPEVGTAGRYMVGPVPMNSTLASERPSNIVSTGYMQLSGTSFAAPIVAGAAAHILALHPEFTPNQVKGALMVTARPINATDWPIGVGELNAVKASTYSNPPNPNAALDAFLVADPATGELVFDAASWNSTVQGDASWNSASWNSASWNSASWNSESWNSASWNSASWNSESYAAASLNDSALEDAVLGDINGTEGYALTPEEQAALDADPDLVPLVPLPGTETSSTTESTTTDTTSTTSDTTTTTTDPLLVTWLE
jgi:serine protease AprX